jgi:AcrR family transcriptional regulator
MVRGAVAAIHKRARPRASVATSPTQLDSRSAGPAIQKSRGDDLRNNLVRHGRRLLEATGSKELSLRSVATGVGVSVATPAYYFGGKEGLLAEIAISGYEDLIKVRRRILAQEDSALEKSRLMLFSYVEFALQNHGTFQLMFGTRIEDKYKYPGVFEVAAESLLLFSTPLSEYAATRGWSPEAMRYVVHAAWVTEHGLATLLIARQVPLRTVPVDTSKMAETAIAMLLAAVAAGPEAMQRVLAATGDTPKISLHPPRPNERK